MTDDNSMNAFMGWGCLAGSLLISFSVWDLKTRIISSIVLWIFGALCLKYYYNNKIEAILRRTIKNEKTIKIR